MFFATSQLTARPRKQGFCYVAKKLMHTCCDIKSQSIGSVYIGIRQVFPLYHIRDEQSHRRLPTHNTVTVVQSDGRLFKAQNDRWRAAVFCCSRIIRCVFRLVPLTACSTCLCILLYLLSPSTSACCCLPVFVNFWVICCSLHQELTGVCVPVRLLAAIWSSPHGSNSWHGGLWVRYVERIQY